MKTGAPGAQKPRYVVSGCLAGLPCRFDGTSSPCPEVIRLVQAGLAVPICPESLSGLPVPRPPCEQRIAPEAATPGMPGLAEPDGRPARGKNAAGGPDSVVRVVSRDGQDVTGAFVRGARRALALALKTGCTGAILKARSPSCGVGQVYDGSFSRTLRPGDGLWAALLREAGFSLYTEDDLPEPPGA